MSNAFFFEQALLPHGWAESVRIAGDANGNVAHIEVGARPQRDDRRYRVALPGLPNLHSHAFQRAMAGLTEVRASDQDSFWTWRERMYQFLAQLDPEHVHHIASLAYMEMLEVGFTHVCEFHYLHHDPRGHAYHDPAAMCGALVSAATETGIGLTLLPVFYACGGFGGQPTGDAQRRFVNTERGFAQLHDAASRHVSSHPTARVGVALHSLRAVEPAHIDSVTALAPNGPVHIHVAEQPKEVADCIAWSGRRPVEWLLENTAVDRRWCLVHATHMTQQERRALAQSGAVAGVCPITEANLGDGIFDGVRYLADGGVLGVGSDSNVQIDAAQELALLEYSQRLRDGARNRLVENGSTGRSLLQRAVAGGAQASGARVGGLEFGARLDFITLNSNHPSLVAQRDDGWLDAWIFAAGSSAIDDVWVAGQQRVANGRHIAREDVAGRYAAALGTLI